MYPIKGHDDPLGCGCTGPHIRSHTTALGRDGVASPTLGHIYPRESGYSFIWETEWNPEPAWKRTN